MEPQRNSGLLDTTGGLFLRAGDSRVAERFAIVYLDLAGLAKAADKLDKRVIVEMTTEAKKIIRGNQAPFAGTEFDKSAGIGVLFERPVEAVGYALALVEQLGKLQSCYSAPLQPRVGIDFGLVNVEGLETARQTRAVDAIRVKGEAREVAVGLMKKAEVGQVLMTRAVFDLAQSAADGSDAIPAGTRWTRLGRTPLGSLSQAVDLCEASLPAGAARSDTATSAGQTMIMAFEFGANHLLTSLGGSSRRGRSVAEGAKPGGRTGTTMRQQDLIGTHVAHYRIEGLRSSEKGRWAFVARDEELQRDVALKLLPPDETKEHLSLQRFIREGLTNLFLHHPNIASAYDAGCDDGRYFLASELVRGTTLREIVETADFIEPRLAVGYAIQVARALGAMHERGIIHRDVQPESLVLSQQGILKFQSFALAKVRDLGTQAEMKAAAKAEDTRIPALAMGNLTVANTSLGRPEFAAPEQLKDAASVDGRADQYSLGCLLVYLMKGAPPVRGVSAMEMQARLGDGIKSPLAGVAGVLDGLESVVARLLAVKPDNRFPSMMEVVDALEKVQGLRQDTARGSRASSSSEHIDSEDLLATAARQFNGATWARLRSTGWILLLVAFAIGAATIALANDFRLGMALVGVSLLTPFFHLLLDGLFFNNPLFRRLIRLFARPSLAGIGVGLGLAALAVGGIYLVGLLMVTAVVLLVSLGLAVGWQLLVILPLKFQRSTALREVQAELKRLRSSGRSEDQVRETLFEAAGADWEEIYETLFGYDAKIAMRAFMKGAGRLAGRRKHAAWRDGLALWLVEIEEARAEARAQRALEEAETEKLTQSGIGVVEARAKARVEAQRVYHDERAQYAAPVRPATASGAVPIDSFGASIGGYGQTRLPRNYYASEGQSPLRWILTAVRSAIGGGILVLYAGPSAARMAGIVVPPTIQDALITYYSWGMGGQIYALVIGGLIMQNANSTKYFTTTIAALGAVMMVATVPMVALVDNNPPFDSQMAVFTGATMIFIGYGLRRLTSVGGMRRMMPF